MAKTLNMTKAQESRLDCICGLCQHDCMDKGCLFNKIMDSLTPEAEQKKQFLAWAGEVVKANTSAASRDKIK